MDRGNSRQQNTELTTVLNQINLCTHLPLDFKNSSLYMLETFHILVSEIFYKLESSSRK